MPLIQEVSGFGVAVPEMECNRVVEDCSVFNLGVHSSLIELVKAENVAHQPLHGLVPDAGVVALSLRAGAVPRPCWGAVLALSGLAAVIRTAAAAFDEAGEFVEQVLRVRLDTMLFNNPDRIKYHERYQEIIEDYNSQQDRATIEKTFDELMQLVKDMDQEEQRYVREGFSSDEELSLYDMLFSENLSKQDIQKIKKVAVDLLEKVKAKIAELDHWTDKQETKATIDNLIRDTLWAELPESYDEVSISVYRQKIYEYVYTRYKNVA